METSKEFKKLNKKIVAQWKYEKSPTWKAVDSLITFDPYSNKNICGICAKKYSGIKACHRHIFDHHQDHIDRLS